MGHSRASLVSSIEFHDLVFAIDFDQHHAPKAWEQRPVVDVENARNADHYKSAHYAERHQKPKKSPHKGAQTNHEIVEAVVL